MSEYVLLVSDPNGPRRQGIIQKCTDIPQIIVHGASTLSDTYRLAESLLPMRVAVAAEIANSREFETLSEMIAMIGADLILYGGTAQIKSAKKFIPLREANDLDRLVSTFLAGLAPVRLRGKTIPACPEKTAELHGVPSPPASQIILVGASTGGIPALETVLQEFPENCPPTLVVQHIRSGFASGLIQRLNQTLAPKVVAAEDRVSLQSGTIYFAADPTRHLGVTFQNGARTRLISGEAVSGHCPSVDVLFKQAAALPHRVELRAALLTGMGFDGAEGMAELRRSGALTIAQDRESSVVWGMPRVAVEKGAACEVLPLSRIGRALLRPKNSHSLSPAKHKI